MVFFYWLFLIGTFFLAGSFVSRFYITGPSGMDVCRIGEGERCLGELAARAMAIVAVLALVAHAVHMVLHAEVMTDTPLRELPDIMPAFLLKTRYGRFIIVKTIILFFLMILSFLSLGQGGHRKITIAGVFFSALMVISISMSGHQGVKGYASAPFALDLFHSASVVCWVGGLFFIRLCFSFFGGHTIHETAHIFTETVKRLSGLATISVFIVALTGIGLVLNNIREPMALVNTRYGGVLTVKALLAGSLFLLGGMNKYFLFPRVQAAAEEGRPVEIHFRRLLSAVTVEVFVGLIILLVTAYLTHLSPQE